MKWILIVIVSLIVIGYISEKDKQTNSIASHSGNKMTEQPKKEKVEDSYPDQVKRFIQIVEQAISDAKASINDMQKGELKADRTDALCDLLKNKSVKNWVGKVHTVDSYSDGKTVLTLKLAREISVNT